VIPADIGTDDNQDVHVIGRRWEMSEEGRKLIDKLMEVVSGQPLGAVREAVVNLMAALIISDADTEEQMEQALEDLGGRIRPHHSGTLEGGAAGR
jgi:hypothetical protein